MSDAIRLTDVTLGYDRHPAVHHLEGVVADGDLLAICGPDGAGKSTLLKAISGALTPMGGAITRVNGAAHAIAYLPQAAEIDRSFPINVFDLVSTGCWRETGWFGGFGGARKAKILNAISAVGLDGFEARPIAALSGGQTQRMLFARIIVQDAPLILLDEPLTALDERTANDLIALVRKWNSEGRTIIAVLHDLDLVRRVFPKTLLLAREKVAWCATQQALTAENLARARSMCEAYDEDAEECERVA